MYDDAVLVYSCATIGKPCREVGQCAGTHRIVVSTAFNGRICIDAVGKCVNGFIADYCNIRRFMAVGLIVSAMVNLLMALMGYYYESVEGASYARYMVYGSFILLWGFNGWAQSMGAPPGVISLSRWFPKSKRGTFYSLFSSSP